MLEAFAGDFLGFLGSSPSPWHAARSIAERLAAAGFREQDPSKPFEAGRPGERSFLRRSGAVVAWIVPSARPARLVLGLAHTDSPCLRLRPEAESISHGCRKLSTECYGGLLNHTWLDRELEVAGRVCAAGPDGPREILVRPALRPVVPSLAIHLDRGVNERGLVLDRERHLAALCGLQDGASFLNALAHAAGVDPDSILSWDLCLSDAVPPALAGAGDLVVSPRLDNLASCHALVTALRDPPTRDDSLVAVAFLDAEEVGSGWPEGADSSFLPSILERIAAAQGLDRSAFLALAGTGLALSCDMAHAVHPNHAERHAPGHAPLLGQGPVLKWNAGLRYGTSAPGAAVLRSLAEAEGIPLQTFVMRADLACGSTVGPLVAAQLSLATVDCGAPMLAMHSARETMALSDQFLSTRLYRNFLEKA
jgi:aspartyl aminopeptidase